MKIGDYVRTIEGYIGKITDIIEDLSIDCDTGVFNIAGTPMCEIPYNLKDKYIIKSSPDILDLLEENDLVVIEYYSLRYKERVARLFEVDYKIEEFMTLKNAHCDFMLRNNEFNDKDKKLKPIIKSIITKEQIESIKYEVE